MSNKHLIIGLLVCAAASACGGDDSGSSTPHDDSGTASGLDAGDAGARGLDASVTRDSAASDAAHVTASDGGDALAALCSTICAHTAAAACPRDDDAATCTSGCIDSVAGYPAGCTAPYMTALQCASQTTFACDMGSGKGQPTGCDLELAAFGSCLASPPATDMDSGTSPGVDAATGTTPDASTPSVDASADAARDASVDAASADASDASHDAGDAGDGGDGGDAGDSAVAATSNIPASCDPGTADDACSTCAKTICCQQLSACDAMCRAGAACVDKCDPNDDTCLGLCADATSPSSTTAYFDLSACYADNCDNECGLPK